MSIGTGLSNSLKALAAATLVALLLGCGGGDPEPDATTVDEVATAAPTATPAIAAGAAGPPSDILGLVLESAGRLEMYDVAAISGRDVPRSFRDEFEDSWDDRLDESGIDLYALEALVSSGDEEWHIVRGQIDFDAVRDDLASSGHEDDTYRGYELWEGGSRAAALFEPDGMAVFGASETIRDILQAVSRESGLLSTATDSSLKRLLEKVGRGYVVVASVGCGAYLDIGGCLAYGRRLSAAEGAGTQAYEALQFTSAGRAQAEVEDIEDQVDVTWGAVEVQVDGEFVTVEASVDLGVSEALARFLGTVSPGTPLAPEIVAVPTSTGTAPSTAPTSVPMSQAAQAPTSTPAPAPTSTPVPTVAPVPVATAVAAPAPTTAPAPAPTAAMMMEGPQYGGTFTSITTREPESWDPRVGACDIPHFVYDDLGQGDWTVPREEFSYTGFYVPAEYRVGALAESWEQPDLGTIRFKVREDAVWHDKAPANGRDVTAEDVAYSWSAYTGTGYGFTEPHPNLRAYYEPITSVTAIDDDTVEFKFEPLITMLGLLLTEGSGDSVVNKETLEQYGDLENWEHALGSGPFLLTEVVEGTSYTWEKNPNWWGEDPRYPGNQLPYIDVFRLLDIRDWAAQKAVYRTGKVDELGGWASVVTITPSQADSIIDSNPETEHYARWPEGWGIGMRMDDPDKPWMDIRVRRALQKAVPTEEIANDYYEGFTEPALYPIFGSLVKGFFTPYEEWSDEVRENYDYDLEAAKSLMAEAGYPDGFEVNMWLGTGEQDPELAQIVKGYLAQIGVDITIEEMEWGVYWSRMTDGELVEWHWDWTGPQGSPLPRLSNFFTSDAPYLKKFWNDPVVDKGVENALVATDMEEYTNIIKDVADHIRDQQYRVLFPLRANVAMWHPYVEGFNGEWYSGVCNTGYVYAHVWLDPDKKRAMGY